MSEEIYIVTIDGESGFHNSSQVKYTSGGHGYLVYELHFRTFFNLISS